MHEASVSVPLTDLQTRFIAGQIPDWSGYEYLQPTLNKLITHNLLFDFTLPTAYIGAGIEITSGKWIDQGRARQHEHARKQPAGNKAPVIAYRVDYSQGRVPGLRLRRRARQGGQLPRRRRRRQPDHRPTPTTCSDTRVDLFEVDAYFIRGDWTVQGQFSYGQQKDAAITADPATGELRDAAWWGLSAPGGLQVHAALRGHRRASTTSTTRRTAAACSATASPTTATASARD